MSAEPDTTLAWAEFLWTVTKEAPEVVFAYLILLDFMRRRRQRDVVIHAPAAAAILSAPSPAIFTNLSALGRSTTRMELTTG